MLHSKIQDKIAGLKKPGTEEFDRGVQELLDALPYIRESHEAGPSEASDVGSPIANASSIQQFLDITESGSHKDLYTRYMAEVEHDEDAIWHVCSEADDMVCPACSAPLVLNTTESVVICKACGTATPFMEGSTRNLNYHEQMEYNSKRQYTYKRLSHFTETLMKTQGKENTSIPPEIMDAMHQEIKKHRMDVRELKPYHIRQFLKRRGVPKLYEHTNTILGLLQGKSQKIPEHIETQLKQRFLALQKPFQIVCENDSSRRNMLRYNYIIYKLLQMIPGGEEYLHLFPLLKSRTKLKEHDDMWRRILAEMDDRRGEWVFHPTI
jgi:uncharacterized Zn finger protein (UPF0148 family)